MKIVVLDQHSDLTRSLLQQFNELGHKTYIADNSIIPLPKWKPEILKKNNYMFPFKIANREQLLDGYFDIVVNNTPSFCPLLKSLTNKSKNYTKRVFFNGSKFPTNLPFLPDNILCQDTKTLQQISKNKNAALFVITLPKLHSYHGPNLSGDFIGLIFSFSSISSSECKNIVITGTNRYIATPTSKRKVIIYGDPDNKIHDTKAFPRMFCLLHIKNLGAGMDYALAKTMTRGIPPILYKPYTRGSVCDEIIDDSCAFIFDKPGDLVKVLLSADESPNTVIEKGIKASERIQQHIKESNHMENLKKFLERLK